MPVAVATMALKEVSPTSELTGRLEAVHHVDVRVRVSGYVTAIKYREGDQVAAGATLFTIDARPYQAVFARASADVARSRAKVDIAKIEAGRGEKLLAANAIPRAERDQLASSETQASAEEQSAQASLELARLDLEFTQVRAPVAGRTGRAIVNVGDYVTAGTTIATSVASLDPMYVYFTGDEATYLRFASKSDHAVIHIGLSDETGFPHAGLVDFVDNRLDASTGTILVRAVIENKDHRLAPGLFARVQLPEGTAVKVMLVDDKAILTDQDRKYVYVLDGDKVARRDVTLGRIIEGQRAITDGLKVGDRVIVNNLQKVFPGSPAKAAP
jgi:multidrug efflux system membrane fusion protein